MSDKPSIDYVATLEMKYKEIEQLKATLYKYRIEAQTIVEYNDPADYNEVAVMTKLKGVEMKKSEFYKKIADAWKLVEGSGVKEVIKTGGVIENISEVSFSLNPLFYEFAIAVVEGKAVFIGDELYFEGKKYAVLNTYHLPFRECSWNPPKPKTVMVEMLESDVKEWGTYGREALEEYFKSSSDPYAKRSMRFYEACNTAMSCIS